MKITQKKLEKLLVDNRLIKKKDLDKVKAEAKKKKIDLIDHLINEDILSDDEIGRLFSTELNVQFVNLSNESIPQEVLSLITSEMASGKKIIPFQKSEKTLHLGMVDPSDKRTISLIEKKTGLKVKPFLVTATGFNAGLDLYKRDLSKRLGHLTELEGKTSEELSATSIVETVDELIENAHSSKASDIHIEPHEDKLFIRYRIDGMLNDVVTLDKSLLPTIISRIKIMAGLRTDEHRAAQDGKISKKIKDEKIDIRVSIVPLVEGEKAVLRLLVTREKGFGLDDLGLVGENLKRVNTVVKSPWGMILSTGPTGSGKTTTIYSIIKILNKSDVNISTIEDPVEYDIEGVNQIQVQTKSNLTFASGLRSIVRQDPDIIMVGEIRDNETADISVNAALTGHLVLSTLHTNDAATTLPRLNDMKIEPFLIASTVSVVIGQRLVRKICTKCVKSHTVKGAELTKMKKDVPFKKILGKDPKQITVYKGTGCEDCGNTGYKGRIGIFEVLTISEKIKELIMAEENADRITKEAQKEGMTPMMYDGVKKALNGVTTLDEVIRVTKT